MPAYVLAVQYCTSLPSRILNTSLEVYQRLILKRATQGRSREVLVKACINITCKQLNYPFSFPGVERQEWFINRVLHLQYKQVSSEMYASKLGYELGLTEAVITKAIDLVRDEYGLAPATAAIHKASGISLRKLARHTGLSKNYIWRLSKTIIYSTDGDKNF